MKLIGERIYLRPLEEEDAAVWTEHNVKNQDHFQAVTPARDESYYSEDFQLDWIRHCAEDFREDRQYHFGIFLKVNDELIGGISLFQVQRRFFQRAMMGYSLDKDYEGNGYMTEAARLLVDFGFRELKLHRIWAEAKPSNLGSIRVLEKAGFEQEGIARKNVMINGRWEDHTVLSILNPEE
ncbi:GNAT family N-acetyltransferase [Gorillibacterium timonense]|uniref:GNAT family N-acetyltransferase n=1 Tax=Gorillibacterium timonense TaxID=1689269 RepID=UPI00071C259B|nr:GNAT family protein [Gorillibacterium timonense]